MAAASDPGKFALKAYTISVDGFDPYTYFAGSYGKAMAQAFDSYRSFCANCTYKDFLRMTRGQRHVGPDRFGEPITINGRPAFFVSSNLQYVQFSWPGGTDFFNSHPYDVEPEHYRPSTYRTPRESTDAG